MAVKTKETQVENNEGDQFAISTTTFLASKGIELQSRLVKFVIPLFGAIPKKPKDIESILEQDVDFSKVTQSLMVNFTEKKVFNLIFDLCNSTTVNGQDLSKKPLFDTIFSGEYLLLFKTLKYIMEVNFSDFFVENGIISSIMEMIPKTEKEEKKEEEK